MSGFHEAIVDDLKVIPTVKPEMLMGEGVRLFGVPVIENQGCRRLARSARRHRRRRRRARFREAKSHRDMKRSDELELAFYWLLLAPYRAAPKADPRGVLILRRDGAPVEVEIEITENLGLAEARRLIAEVRHVRGAHGVRPRMCGCPSFVEDRCAKKCLQPPLRHAISQ